MTPADDRAKALMRAYADNVQPPPVADVIDHAEQTRDAPHSVATVRPRRRGRLVFAAAAVAAAVAAVAVATDRLPDRGTADAPAATQRAASTGVAAAPGCPPALPLLDEPLDVDGKASKPIAVQAGQQLTLTARTRPSDPDRRLLSFTIYLMPPGAHIIGAVISEPAAELLPVGADQAVSQSPVLRLTPDQQRVSPILQIPTGLAPGTYDLVGYATFPSPSLCGVANPTDSTQVGATWGVLASVVIN